MKIRILTINESPPDPQTIAAYGLSVNGGYSRDQTVLCLIEELPDPVRQEMQSVVDGMPEAIKILESERSRFLFRLYDDHMSKLMASETVSRSIHLQEIFDELKRRIGNYLNPSFAEKDLYGLNLKTARIMGVLNVTPDSFSDGGKYLDHKKAVSQALKMAGEGAAIIDVGGESSRPGADPVSTAEELARVIPVIEAIRSKSAVLISIDTYKSVVADKALSAGADWINDISGFRADPDMIEVAGKYDCPLVVMHMLGTPKTMQENPVYGNVCLEVNDFFEERIKTLSAQGLNKLILDPGIGFGKRQKDNLNLLQCCDLFRQHGFPIMIGASRKSFIGAITGRALGDRMAGSLAALLISVLKGALIVRVHDVPETKDALKMIEALTNVQPENGSE